MPWTASFKTHPRYEQAARFATGRPAWVLKATGLVAAITFAIPLILAALLLIGAAIVTALAWVVFSTLGRVVDTLTGAGRPQQSCSAPPPPADDGRENVRVIHRH